MNWIDGIGGIFIRAEDPKFLARWYEDHFGIGFGTNVYFSFKWREQDTPENICRTDFSFMATASNYFDPGNNNLMLNFRVKNLEAILDHLKAGSVEVIERTESYEYGKFGWALDPAGNKIELWEPIEKGFGEPLDKLDLYGQVSGIGGIFIKYKEPKRIMDWYHDKFGIAFNYSSHSFLWKDLHAKQADGRTVFSIFDESSAYFHPSKKNFMINFRVKNLNELLRELKSSSVDVDEKIETFDYGKFGWVMDPEGNRIELWEAGDESVL